MECDKCGDGAVMSAPYSGLHLCEPHFLRSVEKRARRRIREDGLLSTDATPGAPETWVIGLSGGKDSAVLADLLCDTFERDPRVELVALTVHEGIEGYRDESVAACEELVAELGLRHELVTYEEEFGVRMDEVAEKDPLGMAPCAYCGVFRRDVLARYAEQFGADKLLTGHNLDDEAQTALMNLLKGDVAQIAKQFDASLGAFEERADGPFVPRAKPLRDIPEKEIALYAHLKELPVHAVECPHAGEAFRGEVQSLLYDLEEAHPGTRHSIMAGYEELSRAVAGKYRDDEPPGECERCGRPTRDGLCRACQLVDAVG